MQTAGLIYLLLYLADAGLSCLALVVHSLEPASNALSSLHLPFALVFLGLAAFGKVQPRKPYLVATGYYFFMVFSGVVLIAAAVAQGGEEVLRNEPTLASLAEMSPWLTPVLWALPLLMVAVAVYALRARNAPTSAPVAP